MPHAKRGALRVATRLRRAFAAALRERLLEASCPCHIPCCGYAARRVPAARDMRAIALAIAPLGRSCSPPRLPRRRSRKLALSVGPLARLALLSHGICEQSESTDRQRALRSTGVRARGSVYLAVGGASGEALPRPRSAPGNAGLRALQSRLLLFMFAAEPQGRRSLRRACAFAALAGALLLAWAPFAGADAPLLPPAVVSTADEFAAVFEVCACLAPSRDPCWAARRANASCCARGGFIPPHPRGSAPSSSSAVKLRNMPAVCWGLRWMFGARGPAGEGGRRLYLLRAPLFARVPRCGSRRPCRNCPRPSSLVCRSQQSPAYIRWVGPRLLATGRHARLPQSAACPPPAAPPPTQLARCHGPCPW